MDLIIVFFVCNNIFVYRRLTLDGGIIKRNDATRSYFSCDEMEKDLQRKGPERKGKRKEANRKAAFTVYLLCKYILDRIRTRLCSGDTGSCRIHALFGRAYED
jgi:hypothetical protein